MIHGDAVAARVDGGGIHARIGRVEYDVVVDLVAGSEHRHPVAGAVAKDRIPQLAVLAGQHDSRAHTVLEKEMPAAVGEVGKVPCIDAFQNDVMARGNRASGTTSISRPNASKPSISC